MPLKPGGASPALHVTVVVIPVMWQQWRWIDSGWWWCLTINMWLATVDRKMWVTHLGHLGPFGRLPCDRLIKTGKWWEAARYFRASLATPGLPSRWIYCSVSSRWCLKMSEEGLRSHCDLPSRLLNSKKVLESCLTKVAKSASATCKSLFHQHRPRASKIGKRGRLTTLSSWSVPRSVLNSAGSEWPKKSKSIVSHHLMRLTPFQFPLHILQ